MGGSISSSSSARKSKIGMKGVPW